MRKLSPLLLCMFLLAPAQYAAQSVFDSEQSTWTITNGWVRAAFQLTQEGYFQALSFVDLKTGDRWDAAADQPSSPIRFRIGTDVLDAKRQYSLVEQYTQATTPSGLRQYIVLQDISRTAQVTLVLRMYDDQPVLRYHVVYKNLTGSTQYVTALNMLSWSFAAGRKQYTTLRVNQWSVEDGPGDFEPVFATLQPDNTPVEVYSGAHGEQCSWLALHDSDGRGLFAGWEFDGRSKSSVKQTDVDGRLDFGSYVLDLHHPVDPADTFTIPTAFIGLFHGDFDEAGYRTHQFVNAVLAKNSPDPKTFPYISWDSWGYGTAIDELTLRRNADRAAALGVELFIVDLGWARSIGDWYADPQKFPNGLGGLSDYVHSLGMKFGLHFVPAEADPRSPVLQANPDWTASQNDNYHGAASLCLAHQPAKDWIVQQAIRMIDDYHVDWILQDGENMVKTCTKTSHTHDPADSNYSNSVNGINAVVAAIQAARPNVFWENCEDGGNMMTFNMVKSYVTSITSDADGSLSSRRAVFGATYPFPPRYATRYMPDSDGLNPYATNSYRFGGNWVLMNRLLDLNVDELGFLKQQIEKYKDQRLEIAGGKVFHIAPPDANSTDVIQSYNAATDSAIAVITRAQSTGSFYVFRPKGLDPDQRYAVWFDTDVNVYWMSGGQLMDTGVRVLLPTPFSSDVAHIQRQ